MNHLLRLALILIYPCLQTGHATTVAGPKFKRVVTIIFENTDYSEAVQQPFLSQLISQGAVLQNFNGEGHPSQGNYIALTSGSTNGVTSDSSVNLNVNHIGDLLQAKGLTWKVYAEQYPGNCFLGATSGTYARKHVPFISYVDVQKNAQNCANITSADNLMTDLTQGKLPDYVMYIPDLKNDGHDTGVAYADNWLKQKFGPLLSNSSFMSGTLLVITFDEDGGSTANHILTVLVGDGVTPGSSSMALLNHYSLLKLVEDNFGLGDLGKEDKTAAPIVGIWN